MLVGWLWINSCKYLWNTSLHGECWTMSIFGRFLKKSKSNMDNRMKLRRKLKSGKCNSRKNEYKCQCFLSGTPKMGEVCYHHHCNNLPSKMTLTFLIGVFHIFISLWWHQQDGKESTNNEPGTKVNHNTCYVVKFAYCWNPCSMLMHEDMHSPHRYCSVVMCLIPIFC